MRHGSPGLSCLPVTGVGEIRAGDDLAGILAAHGDLRDGDVLVVTSKVVSKAEGRVVVQDRAEAVAEAAERVVASRGATSIVRTHHGLVIAAAGIDASNTEPGTIVLLPEDPDASARTIRASVAADGGPNIAVVISDTAGRAWRNGQIDLAIGAAGLHVMPDYDGRTDDYGNLLQVTAPAVADEIASAGDLVKGKLGRSPAAVLRGLEGLVLPRGEDGAGARTLVRDESHDMFGYGAREAVLLAVHPDPDALPGFGRPAHAEDLAAALSLTCPVATTRVTNDRSVEVHVPAGEDPTAQRRLGGDEARLVTAAHAMGWRRAPAGSDDDTATSEVGLRLRFLAPTP